MCRSCIHQQPAPKGVFLACRAFPKGIPDAIALEYADHRQPFADDNGIRFEQHPMTGPPDWSLYE